jgi:hypothetical protein
MSTRNVMTAKAVLISDALQGRDYVQASNDHAALAEMDMRS